MWITTPDNVELVQDTVVAIEALEAEGLFNPFTDQGESMFAMRMQSCLRVVSERCAVASAHRCPNHAPRHL